MGVDFNALVEHRLRQAELYLLPARLNQAWTAPAQLASWVSEYVKAGTAQWTWDRDQRFSTVEAELLEAKQPYLDGPHGFHATVYQHAVDLSHLSRWWSFLHEKDLQESLRSAVRLFASLVGARTIIYVPDSAFGPSTARDLVSEGVPVADAVERLRSSIGPPSPFVIQNDAESDETDERAWFYEEIAG